MQNNPNFRHLKADPSRKARKKVVKMTEAGKTQRAEHIAKKKVRQQEKKLRAEGKELDDERKQLMLKHIAQKEREKLVQAEADVVARRNQKERDDRMNADRMGHRSSNVAEKQRLEAIHKMELIAKKAGKLEITVEDPEKVVSVALELALLGQEALERYWGKAQTIAEVQKLDVRVLTASVTVEYAKRKAPVQVKAGMLWRFAVTLWDYRKGDREKNLLLAIRCYEILSKECDRSMHALKYACIQNSKELAEVALARLRFSRQLSEANDESKPDESELRVIKNVRAEGFKSFSMALS